MWSQPLIIPAENSCSFIERWSETADVLAVDGVLWRPARRRGKPGRVPPAFMERWSETADVLAVVGVPLAAGLAPAASRATYPRPIVACRQGIREGDISGRG
jgi:hypothetical protein